MTPKQYYVDGKTEPVCVDVYASEPPVYDSATFPIIPAGSMLKHNGSETMLVAGKYNELARENALPYIHDFDDLRASDFNAIINEVRRLREQLRERDVIVKCDHCGQWAAVKTACKHCGAPVG